MTRSLPLVTASVLVLLLVHSTSARAATAYVTDFDLTESPISEQGAWSQTGLDWNKVVTAGGLAFGTQTGNGGFDDSYAYLSGFTPDQLASAVVQLGALGGGVTHEVELLLRWADSEHSARGYECNFAHDGQYADIVRWNGPKDSFTYLVPTLTAAIPGGLHNGDTVSAKIIGHTITTYVNGTQILTVTDNTFNDGNPGIGFFRGGPSGPQNDFSLTHFSASSLNATTPAPVPALGWGMLSFLALASVAAFPLLAWRASLAARRFGS